MLGEYCECLGEYDLLRDLLNTFPRLSGEKDLDLLLALFNGSLLGENDLLLDLGLAFCLGGGDLPLCLDWDGDLLHR